MAARVDKLGGYDLFRSLGQPLTVLAPMVDGSELAFRALTRRWGTQLCFSPMMYAEQFIREERYRKKYFSTCEGDRPLVVQFCGKDPHVLVQATALLGDRADVVDVNLGCPKRIAQRGGFGACLQDDWPLIRNIVSALHQHAHLPVSCKIRVFSDVSKTVRYAQLLEDAGCQLLTVHGRTKDQIGLRQGLADWQQIKAVKDAVTIPVIANGNLQTWSDVEACLRETGADAVMSGEGLLYNPALFQVWCGLESCTPHLHINRTVKYHVSLMLHSLFQTYPHLQEALKSAQYLSEIMDVVQNASHRVGGEDQVGPQVPPPAPGTPAYAQMLASTVPHAKSVTAAAAAGVRDDVRGVGGVGSSGAGRLHDDHDDVGDVGDGNHVHEAVESESRSSRAAKRHRTDRHPVQTDRADDHHLGAHAHAGADGDDDGERDVQNGDGDEQEGNTILAAFLSEIHAEDDAGAGVTPTEHTPAPSASGRASQGHVSVSFH